MNYSIVFLEKIRSCDLTALKVTFQALTQTGHFSRSRCADVSAGSVPGAIKVVSSAKFEFRFQYHILYH